MSSYDVNIWMPTHIGEALKETLNFGAEAFGAYNLLLLHYWLKAGNVEKNEKELMQIMRLKRGKKGSAIYSQVLDLFEIQENKIVIERIDQEYAKALEYKEKNRLKTRKAREIKLKNHASLEAEQDIDIGFVTDGDTELPLPSTEPSTKSINSNHHQDYDVEDNTTLLFSENLPQLLNRKLSDDESKEVREWLNEFVFEEEKFIAFLSKASGAFYKRKGIYPNSLKYYRTSIERWKKEKSYDPYAHYRDNDNQSSKN